LLFYEKSAVVLISCGPFDFSFFPFFFTGFFPFAASKRLQAIIQRILH